MRCWLIYNEKKYKDEINSAICLESGIYEVDTCKIYGTIIYNIIATESKAITTS